MICAKMKTLGTETRRIPRRSRCPTGCRRCLWLYTCLFLSVPSPTLLSSTGGGIGNDVVFVGVTGTCNVIFGVGVNLGLIVHAHALPAVFEREREIEREIEVKSNARSSKHKSYSIAFRN
jgi:hypothetical protein